MRYTTKWRKPASPCYARLRFGITQQQLADILGVSRSLVTMMEQGKREFPRGAGDIYLSLCRKADELPFSKTIHVKRGRKPKSSGSTIFSVPVVSNYRMPNFDTKLTRKSWSKRATWAIPSPKATAGEAMPSPKATAGEAVSSLEARAGEIKKDPGYDAFMDKLKEQKNYLQHYYKLLKFKKELVGQRHTELSAKLETMNKTIVALKALEESLPEGRSKKRIKILNGFNSWKQVQLSKQVNKWDVAGILKTEWQMNSIQRQIELRDEWIGALSSEAVVRDLPYVYSSSSLAV